MKNRFRIVVFTFLSMVLTNCGSDDNGDNPDLQNQDPGSVQENRPPDDFVLTSLPDDTTDVDLFPIFKWEASDDPDGDSVVYDILLDQSSDPQTLAVENINDITHQLTDRLKRNTRYFWKVIAKDGNGGASQSDIFTFETRDLQLPVQALTDQAQFPPIATLHQMAVEFQNRLWIIGGADENGISNEIWVSDDGQNWLFHDTVPFTARRGFTLTVFDGKLWVIGGLNDSNIETSEIWFTENVLDWDSDINGAANRWGHSTVVFDGKLWIYGGLVPTGNITEDSNDILMSTNGLNWSSPISSQKFSPRAFHEVVLSNNRLYLIGGLENNSETQKINDVWTSSDGATWAKATNFDIALEDRGFYNVVSLDDRLWLYGGREQGSIPGIDDVYYNDIWISDDGSFWSRFTNDGNYSPRALHDVVVFDGNILLIGGVESFDQFLQDVWKFE